MLETILIVLGIFLAPRFTLGCVLINGGSPILGVVAIVWSILTLLSSDED